MKVWILLHYYEFCNKNATKILGIYESEKNAIEAKERFAVLEGFSEYPRVCLVIEEYELGKDSPTWNQGFFPMNSMLEQFHIITDEINKLAGLNISAEDAWKNYEYYDVYCVVSDMIYGESDEEAVISVMLRMIQNYMNVCVPEEECRACIKEIYKKIDEFL